MEKDGKAPSRRSRRISGGIRPTHNPREWDEQTFSLTLMVNRLLPFVRLDKGFIGGIIMDKEVSWGERRQRHS